MSRAIPTQYGFKWGACEVSRLYDHGGHVTMELKTDAAKLSIRVTPSGQVRVEQTAGRGSAVKMEGMHSETITIPEVRNDRPIPVKGGVDG